MTRALPDNLAARLGLPPAVVEELLSRGWRYVDEVGRIPVWEHPSWSLQETRRES